MAHLWPDIPTRICTNWNMASSVPLSSAAMQKLPLNGRSLSRHWLAVPLFREPLHTSINPSVWTLVNSLLPTTKLRTKAMTAFTSTPLASRPYSYVNFTAKPPFFTTSDRFWSGLALRYCVIYFNWPEKSGAGEMKIVSSKFTCTSSSNALAGNIDPSRSAM